MMKFSSIPAVLFALVGTLWFSSAMAVDDRDSLYPGEERVEAAGHPAVIRFIKGEPNKPLLVFVPGTNHMARIAYGGHEGYRETDFLAYWLHQEGYNFLGISYPLDTESGVFAEPQPDFTVREWGRQTIELAKRTLESHNLNGPVIVMGWSMGGKIAQSVQSAADELGVDLDSYLSFVATPPIPGQISLDRMFEALPSGYADRRDDRAGWFAQLAANSERAGHEIVPEPVFMQEYTGDISINQEGYQQRYRDGKFVIDREAGTKDNGAFDFAHFPLVGMLLGDDRMDSRHALTDSAAWSLYNANTVYRRYIRGNDVDLNALNDGDWRALLDLTQSSPERLSVEVGGNHFFFVGESGARRTARAIETLIDRIHGWRSEVFDHLGLTPDSPST
ncbi:alpha/beta fold hydrolase [Vreelandella titanicae]|uniref:alpha/beta fold hydrolase n=1 Tax=Halomonadaceae TaxID=28256 RepID=UPI00059B1CFD|nr:MULTISPECIES: alpha/beta fold hydrolase [Halomonas]KIN14921.1 hypothetical protein RO22_12105 [Halomonas sp. KHS3]